MRATDLRKLTGHKTQELLLRSTGAPIAPGYLRPYALVHTPSFLEASTARVPVGETDARTATLFTFGYAGHGSGTVRLVRAVDKVERARGFEPPIWVDTRISRSVRAAGFRDDAFARLLGDRYRWMRDLGNEAIQSDPPTIRIRRPEAVVDLLALAFENRRRRVIFFCSCAGASPTCHRMEVRRLLIAHARKNRERVRVIEWPGGEPCTLALDVPSTAMLGRTTIPISDEAMGVAIPWGSLGILRAGSERAKHVLLGPALFGGKETLLRVMQQLESAPPADPRAFALRWRRRHACEAETS